jgi:hypothetical protein
MQVAESARLNEHNWRCWRGVSGKVVSLRVAQVVQSLALTLAQPAAAWVVTC